MHSLRFERVLRGVYVLSGGGRRFARRQFLTKLVENRGGICSSSKFLGKLLHVLAVA